MLGRFLSSIGKLSWCRTEQLLLCQKMQWNTVTSYSPRVDIMKYYSGLQGNLQKNYQVGNSFRTFLSDTPKRDDSLPKLVYLQYPLKYLRARLGLWRLRYFWDPSFDEEDFKAGSKQAAIVMADSIRNQDLVRIHSLTTASGFKQVARDMILSRKDPRMKLLKFRSGDIKRAIPVRVYFVEREGRKHCIIDMFFVGMRNVHDFDPHESVEIQDSVRKYDGFEKPPASFRAKYDMELDEDKDKRRIVFAEIFTRFYREYSDTDADDWAVAFYKIATFDVLTF